MSAPVADYLTQKALLRLLAVLLLVLAPHLPRVPLWEALALIALCGWRAAAAVWQWRMPPSLPRMALTLAGFAGVYASYGRISGQTAGVALLALMLALKLTEMRARRDVMVVVFLMYFMLLTHFLFSQEIWTIAYLLVCAAAVTAVLTEASHAGGALPLKVAASSGVRMVAQSLPLMVIIFILFPRIPGPLWGLPSDAGAARSGLSDSMAPGDISHLVESDEVAFRVRFDGDAPPQHDLYWRGPAFWYFDGRTWKSGLKGNESQAPESEPLGGEVAYEVTLEPNRAPWLFALDLPATWSGASDARLNVDDTLLAGKRVIERRLYRVSSFRRYRLQPELPELARRLTTRLPLGYNPRTLALARRWRDQGDDDEAIVREALRMYRSEPFVYTLEPPPLGRDSVDEFLFGTRRGFCEHYASSFTVLMRAAGIPARVVTGYQGGEKNGVGDYYIVRQSDAHAWSEVWLSGRGWVRVDPTAAVAPNRVESGLASALTAAEGLPSFLSHRPFWRLNLDAQWDWLNAQWNHWVLAYGPDLQQAFLARFGLVDWGRMMLALTFIVTGFLALLGLAVLRAARPAPVSDRALQLWRAVQRRLARIGLPQRPDEGPRDFAARVARLRPDLATAVNALCEAYVAARYFGAGSDAETRLAVAVRALRTTV